MRKFWDSTVASRGWRFRRRVGYVPDQPALYDWMTVEEAGWFVAGFYPLGFQRHYNELIEHFELPPDRKIKELSKGMRAKVSLSLAMGHKPELLILDEPTSGLDPLVRREFLESMVDIAGQGRTVLLASHQIAEVERVADVVAIVRDGKLALDRATGGAENARLRANDHAPQRFAQFADGAGNGAASRVQGCANGDSWCGTSMSPDSHSFAPKRKLATSKCGTRRWKRSSWAT